MARKAEVWLKEAGATDTWLATPGSGLSAGQHQAGTCRMGNDPKTSVLNAHAQAHDVKNVFVNDGGPFVSQADKNLTWTIMAAGTDVAVITSGIPRKPGMTREELIGVNAGIVKTVAENILKYSPNTIIIVISNPMDTMTYLALQATGIPKNRIIGMGGTLDSSRFKYQLSQRLGCSAADLNAVVIGGHGDTTMIPLIRHATWNSAPVTSFLDGEQQKQVVADTMTETVPNDEHGSHLS